MANTSSSGTTGRSSTSIMIYVQCVTFVFLCWSFYSQLGWYSIQIGERDTTYYLSPLKSCVYRVSPSVRFQDQWVSAICQDTPLFTAHLTHNEQTVKEAAEVLESQCQTVLYLGVFLFGLLIFEMCLKTVSRVSRVVLTLVMTAFVLVQIFYQMSIFFLMFNLGETTKSTIGFRGDFIIDPFIVLEGHKGEMASTTEAAAVPLIGSRIKSNPYDSGFYFSLLALAFTIVSLGFASYRTCRLFCSEEHHESMRNTQRNLRGISIIRNNVQPATKPPGYDTIQNNDSAAYVQVPAARYNNLLLGAANKGKNEFL